MYRPFSSTDIGGAGASLTAGAMAGSFGALALGWGVSRFALDIPWRPVMHENLAATVATSVLIMVIGVAASAGRDLQRPAREPTHGLAPDGLVKPHRQWRRAEPIQPSPSAEPI